MEKRKIEEQSKHKLKKFLKKDTRLEKINGFSLNYDSKLQKQLINKKKEEEKKYNR